MFAFTALCQYLTAFQINLNHKKVTKWNCSIQTIFKIVNICLPLAVIIKLGSWKSSSYSNLRSKLPSKFGNYQGPTRLELWNAKRTCFYELICLYVFKFSFSSNLNIFPALCPLDATMLCLGKWKELKKCSHSLIRAMVSDDTGRPVTLDTWLSFQMPRKPF